MKSLKVLFVLALFIGSPWVVSAQMVVSPLSSPGFGAGGGGASSEDSPFSDRFNPASSAGKQRVTLDSSYFGLVGTGQSGYGNAFNFGLTVPQRWAVVTGTVSYLGSTFTNLNIGNQGRMTFGVSKDLWEDIYVGANVDTAFGTGGWGLGLGVGFLQYIGDLAWAKNFRWGASLLDMGTGYTVNGISSPPPFTPAFGVQFDAVKDSQLQVTIRPDVSFPSFQDINFDLGSTVRFGDSLTVNLAYRFDLRDTASSTAPTIPFSFGVGYHFYTDIAPKDDVLGLAEKGWNRSEVQVDSAVVPLTGNVYAVGAGVNIPLGIKDTNPPQVKVDPRATYFISPNNDGVQDSLVLPVSMTDPRYIMGYTLQILNNDKQPVRTLQSKVIMPEAQGWDQIWNRLTYVKHGVDIPKALEWNGMTDGGTVAPDGTYSLKITAWDDNGNTNDWSAGTVVVKINPPTAVVSAPVTEFNPIGPRDKLSLVQNGSTEHLWTGTFLDNSGKAVLTRTWVNGSPAAFDWDGKNSDNKVVPDGVYSYTLTATDAAGNKTTAKVSNLIVNSVPTPLDLKVSRTAFSPQGTGVKTIVFQPQAGVSAGLSTWKLSVQDKDGVIHRTLSGTAVLPSNMIFNGNDDGGNALPEGEYKATLTLTYANGNAPNVVSPVFTLKNTGPQATVSSPYQVFSPGAEEGRGVLVFNQTTTEEDLWTGKLTDPAGQVLRTVRWPGKADATYLWDGRGSDGKILPDGTYHYVLEAVDRAGNTGTSTSLEVTIDTAERNVLLASDRSAFTPLSTGTNNKVRFAAQLKEPKGLAGWTLEVRDAADKPVRTWTGTSTIPKTIDWDGKDDAAAPLPDGTYTAHIKTSFGNGTAPTARSNAVVLKNTLPSVTVTADPKVFSPTADSTKPSLTLTQNSSVEAEWTGTVSKAGVPVKTWSWKGQAVNVTWDGTDDAGNKVPDGAYRYEIKTTDAADNTVTQAVDNLVVDTRPTPVFLTVGADGFSPNGNGVAETMVLNARVGLNEGIQSWKLSIGNDTLGPRKTFSGQGPVPGQFVWDGLTDLKSKSEDGKYSAELSVIYEKGNHPVAKSTPFLLEAGPPQLALDMTPQPFSPDNSGTNDVLLINLGVRSLSPVDSWSLEILDPEGHRFILFSGKGAPSAQLKWDGRSGTGELVQSASDYTVVFSAKDTLGNSSTVKKNLAVDVLVLKDGDRLKIVIPSITFAPNKADFLNGIDADKAAKNVAVLKRLAEIFTKYQRYRIGIEGHAVMINWDDPVRGKKEQDNELLPLSKARADAVKDYLVKLGIASARITTEGIGGARPVVPFGDADNRWKDRRVEFWLDRE